ncbi:MULTISPECIES: NADP-dependent oxidoreductase [Auritidibacter]|uniref:NADP-dependent oxidoreductase n=1 Tax=Auritidibacter ignavus TaxID=678932 RepID=A0AAJ6AGD2_9MICC|nr:MULTISPECIES: NADP-dependent oxidoreductase [Auritidibacter]AXR74716.1 NADP-dependent oxidoreductase [Auritidibacter sp. NML130574]NIH71101.1 NADPH:quinone reductase-like Zn-dependent oxidoreductase [Auritidibacter ignavus]RMX22375.1 NADP-dependent oxidoreductase [Auritidibacter ignavus]WGH81244.1 NADP-dependent oxidoreductase [Auritidibacter ignavus]WGH83493.1 NADP-dependent oxidoreductase [Auritidibacter ignavus]
MQIYGFTRYGGPEVSGVLDVEVPEVTENTVLIRTEASGLNPGDLKVRSGARTGSFPVRFPMAMGREAAGTVVSLGPGLTPEVATQIPVGTRVFGSAAAGVGTLGEYTLLTATSATPIPQGLSAAQACCIPTSVGTAWDGLAELEQAGLSRGETLLVLGAGGGVGSAVTGLATWRGLRVVGVASESKKELVESLGASHVPTGALEAVSDQKSPTIAAVFDTVGGQTLTAAATLLAGDHCPPRIRSVADPALATTLGGSGVTRHRRREIFSRIATQLTQHPTLPVVSEILDWDRVAEAVATVESGHAIGNIVVRVS